MEHARKLHDEPIAAEVMFSLADVYQTAGKHDAGSEMYEAAVELTKRLLPNLDGTSKANLAKYFEQKPQDS